MALFDKVSSGDPLRIDAETWNALLDSALAHREATLNRQAGLTAPERSPAFGKVKNNSGGAWGQFAAVAISDPLYDPGTAAELPEWKRRVSFGGYTAEAADVSATPQKVAVMLAPAADGKIADAQFHGVVPCRVNFTTTYPTHRYATLTSGQTYLTSGTTGSVEVVWAESGTGQKWALVRLGVAAAAAAAAIRHKVKGKLDGALSFGGSATLSVWQWGGSAEADSGENVTVSDWLLSTGQSIAAGKQVTAFWDVESGRWYVDGAQCAT